MELSENITTGSTLIKLLKVIGLWPWQPEASEKRQHHHPASKYYGYALHCPLTFTFITLMWIEALRARDLEEAGDVMYMSLTEIALIVKILNIWYFSAEAWQYMHDIATRALCTLRTQDERAFWQQEQRSFGRISFLYMAVSLGVLSTAYVGVLLVAHYELPFAYWLPFEWRDPHNYWYAYGYEIFAMTLTCISNVALDMIQCYFLFHVALLYKLLGKRLEAMQLMKEEAIMQQLRGIFQLHREAKRLSTQCELLVSFPILAQIILSAFILCFSGYRLRNVSFSENPGQFFAMLQFVSVMVLQIFLPCYYANEVTINSNELTRSVYNSNWLNFSVPTRKLIIMYMEFLKRPIKIKSGNFFEVGLPIFTRTMNNAYSFFAVLINMGK